MKIKNKKGDYNNLISITHQSTTLSGTSNPSRLFARPGTATFNRDEHELRDTGIVTKVLNSGLLSLSIKNSRLKREATSTVNPVLIQEEEVAASSDCTI